LVNKDLSRCNSLMPGFFYHLLLPITSQVRIRMTCDQCSLVIPAKAGIQSF